MRAATSIRFDSDGFLAQFAGEAYSSIRKALLPGEPANPLPLDVAPREMLKALLLDPVYQLK